MRDKPQCMNEEKSVCEEKTYQSLYNMYHKALYNFSFYKCGNQDQAADLVQESFIKLWQNCAKIIFDKAKSYLFTVANNHFLNDVAHNKVKLKYQKLSNKDDRDIQSPDFIMEEDEYMQKLEAAIADLTPAQREVFLLNRIDKKKYKEIADLLGISVKAVEKRMHGALVKLKETLGRKL